MKPSKTIKLKALFLLVSFSLNSVVGFACSLGIDMGYNSCLDDHECKEEAGHHEKDKDKSEPEHHSYKLHKHTSEEKHDGDSSINVMNKDHCCESFVVGFQNLDKELVEKSFTKIQHADYAVFNICASTGLNIPFHRIPVRIPPKIPDHSPPNIRVFIQSFQI